MTDEDFEVIQERHPHIGAKLEKFWGTADLNPYISELLHDTREGKRKGFSIDVVLALTSLRTVHHEEFPQFSTGLGGLWDDNA